MISEAVRGKRQHHKAIHAGIVPGLHEACEVGPHAFDPHRVGIVDQEGAVTQPWKSLLHAATGVEQLLAFIGDFDGGTAACFEVLLDQVGLVVHVDHHAGDARLDMAIEHLIDERLAAELYQRLGDGIVGRRHARA
jgi:hypothetical protein